MRAAFLGLTSLCVMLGLLTPAVRADDSIYDIQQGVPPYVPGYEVECDQVVVTGIFFHGFYVQEPIPDPTYEWSGIFCYDPDLYGAGVEVGDLIYVAGTYQEYFDESEIDLSLGTGEVFIYGPTTPIVPTNLQITDLNHPLASENWECVLVNCITENMISTDVLPAGCGSTSPTRWGVYSTDAPTETLFVRNSVGSHEIPIPGSAITFIRGPMSFYRCNRNIIPRNNDDIGYIGPPNLVWAYSTGSTTCDVQFSRDVTEASSENIANYAFQSLLPVTDAERDADDHSLVHLTTGEQTDGELDELFVQNVQSVGGPVMPAPQSFAFHLGITPIAQIQYVDDPGVDDASPFVGEVVTVVGNATSSNIGTGTSYFYMADAAGPWSGLRVEFSGAQVALGDQVMVSGQVLETFGSTYIGWAGYARSVRLGNGYPPDVTPVSAGDIQYNDVSAAEPYESVQVELDQAVVDTSTNASQYGEVWLFDSGSPPDSAKFDVIASGIDDNFYYTDPCPGDVIRARGNLRYSFGQFHIVPRNSNDVKVYSFGPGCAVLATGEIDVPLRMWLRNYPNPFNPSTTISFDLPEAGPVKLEILDPMGRVVRTLIEGALPAGSNEVGWDGRDHAGKPVASGTYFYRVILGEETVTDRMTLLK